MATDMREAEPDLVVAVAPEHAAPDGSAALIEPATSLLPRLVLAAPPVVLGAGAVAHRWLADDGIINVRMVENLVSGRGYTYSRGLRVEAATSPLWTLALAFVHLVTRLPVDAVAVWLGIACTVAGMVLAVLAVRTRTMGAPGGVVIPIGLVAYASYRFAWDFSSSGLENGALVLWIGAIAWSWRRPVAHGADVPWGRAVLYGLGPLLRPDLALVSVVLVGSSLWPLPRWRRTWRVLAAAVALPLAYEVFRAGYFGILVPNTGLAKEGTSLRPGTGLAYLSGSLSQAGGVLLLVSAAAVVAVQRFGSGRDEVAKAARRTDDGPGAEPIGEATHQHSTMIAAKPHVRGHRARPIRRRSFVPPTIPSPAGPAGSRWHQTLVASAIVHLTYVILVGGDFMLGRLLLPGLFFLAVAASGVRVPNELIPRAVLVVAVTVMAFAALVSPVHRVGRLSDEHAFYQTLTGHMHPVGIDDYRNNRYGDMAARALRDGGSGTLVLVSLDPGVAPMNVPLRSGLAVSHQNVLVLQGLGIMTITAGLDRAVLDQLGLADPLAAHQRLVRRGRPGHEKLLPFEWYVAWFGDPRAPLDRGLDANEVAAARRALRCGDLAELVDAVSAPLTAGRFAHNLVGAARLNAFRFDTRPSVAARELCRG